MGAEVQAAEDTVQTALTRCYLKWSRITEGGNPDAYVHRVVINAFIDDRRRWWHRETPTQTVPEHETWLDSSTQVVDRDSIRVALLALPSAQRQVIVLRYFADLTEQQTAEVLNVAIGTVKSRSARALAALASNPQLNDFSETRDHHE
jgi:RNA polymerase sigma-70 factor (sigma-E family)